MTVKPWQKATLSVMAGTTIYAGFLYSVTEKTQQQNKALSQQQQAAIAEEKALETAFQQKKTELVALEKQLHTAQVNTAKVEAQIKAVNVQISQIKAGHIPGAPITASTIPVSVAASSAVPNIQPPPVQSVTKASGLP